MKTGILTHYYGSLNYGGMLQAYALTAFLRKSGFDAEQISYRFSSDPLIKKAAKASAPPAAKRSAAARCRSALRRRLVEQPRKNEYAYYKKTKIADRAASFLTFQNAVPHSERVFGPDTIAQAAPAYDRLITGSDQVWNFDWFNPAFFLAFPDKSAARIAYAASAGKSRFRAEEEDYLRAVLPAFRAISVRESDLAAVLNGLLDTDAVTTAVDPTLLLSAEEWASLAAPRLIGEKYLFCYFLHNDKSLSAVSRRFARKRRLKIASIPFAAIEYNEADLRFGGCRFDAAGPREFLSLILHAEYVLTDSFHASVFSLLFGKPFLAFPRGDAAGMQSRVRTLTELFGCPERFCTRPEKERLSCALSLDAPGTDTDGGAVQEQIRRSKEFLLRALGKD